MSLKVCRCPSTPGSDRSGSDHAEPKSHTKTKGVKFESSHFQGADCCRRRRCAQRQCTVLKAGSATTDGPLFFGQFLPFSRHKSNLEHYNHVDTKWCFFHSCFFFTSAIDKIDGMYLVIRHQMLLYTTHCAFSSNLFHGQITNRPTESPRNVALEKFLE